MWVRNTIFTEHLLADFLPFPSRIFHSWDNRSNARADFRDGRYEEETFGWNHPMVILWGRAMCTCIKSLLHTELAISVLRMHRTICICLTLLPLRT